MSLSDAVTGSEAYRTIIPQINNDIGIPFSNDVQTLFTDLYQITMMYAYWKSDKTQEQAVFDVYFRKCPFDGEFAVLGGVGEVLRYLNTLKFTEDDIRYLQIQLPHLDSNFFDYLRSVDCSCLKVSAVPEGSLVFAHEPVLCVEGPLPVAQLVETAVLNLVSFPTLVASNAARHRLLAGWDKELLEFGTRRSQGPNGAISAARYAYLGGFDGTSNVRASRLFGIPVRGTHAHAFVTSFKSLEDIPRKELKADDKVICEDFIDLVQQKWSQVRQLWNFLGPGEHFQQEGELAAFVAYAQAFPDSLLCLVDTYDTLRCGVPNFIAVALALAEVGYKAIGIRLDSGDLAYLSIEVRKMFKEAAEAFQVEHIATCKIVASNAINEKVLGALNEQGHEVDCFGIGTNLVTCQSEPALGMVYKLAQVNNRPTMKLSQELQKTSVPSRKKLYRLYNKEGTPVIDLITGYDEPPPKPGEQLFCCDLFQIHKRCYFTPQKVEELLKVIWDHGACLESNSLVESRTRCLNQLKRFPKETLRPLNPTPYKVSTSYKFFRFFRDMWERTAPIFSFE